MRPVRWPGLCLALLVLAPPAPAQEKSSLALVPDKAPIVFHLRGFERAKGRLVTLINNALPDLGPRAQEALEEAVKAQLGERQLKGLAPSGPVLVVFTELPQAGQDALPLAVVARVTDAKAFREGFFTAQERKALTKDPAGYETLKFGDADVHVLERDGHLVLASARAALTPFLKVEKGLDARLGAEAARRLLDTDAGVYVDLAEVYRVYGQTVRDMRQFLDLVFQQAGGAVDKESADMAKALLDTGLQAFEDSRGLLVTADFRPDGLAFRAQVTFGGDGKTNQFLKQLAPGDLKDVATLPAGQMSYLALGAEPALLRAFGPFLLGAAGPGGTAGAAVQKALDLLAEAGPQGVLQAGASQVEGLTVLRFQDAAKAARGQLQLYQALTAAESFNRMKLKKAELKTEAQKHRGFTLHHADLVWDFEKMFADLPAGGQELADAMKKMIGAGIKVWFGGDGKVLVTVMAKDWADAQKRLDAYLDAKEPVGGAAAFREVRQRLPARTTILMLYDVPQFMGYLRTMMAGMFKALGQAEIKAPPAQEKAAPTFLGFAATLQDGQAAVDVWVPAAAAREVQKLIESLAGVFGG